MKKNKSGWQASAAYLYILHLEPIDLAWEYLRRNEAYRRDWDSVQRTMPDQLGNVGSNSWGLKFFENPDHDARDVRPEWIADSRPVIRLAPDHDAEAERFSLWDIPGNKTLTHDGKHLLLTGSLGRKQVRIALARQLKDGMPFAYVMPAGSQRHRLALDAAIELLRSSQSPPITHARPRRSALIHMRALHALDGVLAGASHRDIATALFGTAQVQDRWQPDSELRAHVRYLIRRSRSFMNGAYRELLNQPEIVPEGENPPPSDSP